MISTIHLRTPARFLDVLLACAGALLVSAACSRAPEAPPKKDSPGPSTAVLREVRTARAELMPWERTLPAVGELASFDEATISTQVPGRLIELAVDLGSEVRAGAVVARIEPRDYILALAQAEAALQQARARLGLPADGEDDEVDPESTGMVRQARAVLAETRASRERIIGLRKQGVSSQSEEDEAESTFRVAESRLQDALEEVATRRAELVLRRATIDVARAALSDVEIEAPFDGVTLARIAGLGNFLRAGDPIARIARIDPLRLRLDIPERESALVAVGQQVRLEIEGDPNVYRGAIARISPGIDPRNRALTVEAEIPNPRPLVSVPANGHGPDSLALADADSAGDGATSEPVAAGSDEMVAAEGSTPSVAEADRTASAAETGSTRPSDAGRSLASSVRADVSDGAATNGAGRPLRSGDSHGAEVPSAAMTNGVGLRPGAFARAEIVIDASAKALSVPLEAVTSFAGLDKVIAIENGKAVEKRVTLGRRESDRVEVLEGLEPGAEVVLSPGGLQSGQPVQVAR